MLRALVVLALCASCVPAAEPWKTVNVWPVKPPGETKELPAESNLWKDTDAPVGGKPIIKLANVSTPTLAIYKPAKEKDTGASIIICPGGGHFILAYDHEGTEVAEWLNTLGVTGIVLKYRVPARNPNNRSEAAVAFQCPNAAALPDVYRQVDYFCRAIGLSYFQVDRHGHFLFIY